MIFKCDSIREKIGQNQNIEAAETLEKSTNDKLLEKTNWYKENKKRKWIFRNRRMGQASLQRKD